MGEKQFSFNNYHRLLVVFLFFASSACSVCVLCIAVVGLAHRQISAALSSLRVRTVVTSSVSIPYNEYAPARTMTNAGVAMGVYLR